jgi:very-short-patch-repair endonuclease
MGLSPGETRVEMKKKIIPYNSKIKELARRLRTNGALSEVLLWEQLKGKQLLGYAFYRQKPIGDYIVDFFCKELMLALELDGATHNYTREEAQRRQAKLEKLGLKFLRFTDGDVKGNVAGVVAIIEDWVKNHTLPTPSPLPRGDF